jgi:ribosome-associated translation inhibitor RaiA
VRRSAGFVDVVIETADDVRGGAILDRCAEHDLLYVSIEMALHVLDRNIKRVMNKIGASLLAKAILA